MLFAAGENPFLELSLRYLVTDYRVFVVRETSLLLHLLHPYPSAILISDIPLPRRTFVAAIFYVGKGTGLRPFAHFYDAIKALEAEMTGCAKPKKRSEKIQQIHNIWEKGAGVVSHHFFQV